MGRDCVGRGGATGNGVLLMGVGLGTVRLEPCWKRLLVKPFLARDQARTQWKCPYFFARSHVGERSQQPDTQKQKPGKRASLCGMHNSFVLNSHSGRLHKEGSVAGRARQGCRGHAVGPESLEPRRAEVRTRPQLTGGVGSQAAEWLGSRSVWCLDPEVFPL